MKIFIKKKFIKLSEINEVDSGLIIELWNRELTWDTLLGLLWLPLNNIKHLSSFNDDTEWFKLDSELCTTKDGQIKYSKNPTIHRLLVNIRLEDVNIQDTNDENIDYFDNNNLLQQEQQQRMSQCKSHSSII